MLWELLLLLLAEFELATHYLSIRRKETPASATMVAHYNVLFSLITSQCGALCSVPSEQDSLLGHSCAN